MTTAIILAAGKSSRMGDGVDKSFLSLVNRPMLAWSLQTFERSTYIDRIVLVVRKEQQLAAKAVVKMFGISKLDKIVVGGVRRQESVQAGLAACDIDTRYVVVHDGARPCVTCEMIEAVMTAVKRADAVTLGHPLTDTVKRCAATKGAVVVETLPRERLWSVQTPQAFPFRSLRDAYRKLDPKTEVTDDCQAVELAGGTAKIVEWHNPNIKVTTPHDLQLVSLLLK